MQRKYGMYTHMHANTHIHTHKTVNRNCPMEAQVKFLDNFKSAVTNMFQKLKETTSTELIKV